MCIEAAEDEPLPFTHSAGLDKLAFLFFLSWLPIGGRIPLPSFQ